MPFCSSYFFRKNLLLTCFSSIFDSRCFQRIRGKHASPREHCNNDRYITPDVLIMVK
jgi:hypothetical protein